MLLCVTLRGLFGLRDITNLPILTPTMVFFSKPKEVVLLPKP